MTTGHITRIAGPLIEVAGLTGAAMSDLVTLGATKLPGEIVEIRNNTATAQAYEYTGGLRPGEPTENSGQPLSARLGPWLLGNVFDGLLRPLSNAPTWLIPSAFNNTSAEHAWLFTPSVTKGSHISAGEILGVVQTNGPVAHRVLVPPHVHGSIEMIAKQGNYHDNEPIARIDGATVTLATDWPVRTSRPFQDRTEYSEPLKTGQRAVDLLFPIAKGSTAAVPGGFGTGKTILLQQIAKWCDADVIVYIGCGERGNEVAEVVTELFELEDPRTHGRLAERTVIIANTSNMPMMAREASIYTGITVAEYFRDMGYHAVVIADSTSRWAEALREFAARTGALPAEEGYPANLASALAAFYERSGTVNTLGRKQGSVTVIGAVSPPSGDMTEPVTTHTERFVQCRWLLDRDLAYARHYPAISWAGSFSRDAAAIGTYRARNGQPEWAAQRAALVNLLAEADRLSNLVELVGISALPDHERIVVLAGRLIREGLLQQNAQSTVDAYCDEGKTAALVRAILDVIHGCDRALEAEIPAATIEELDFSPLLRAREEATTAAQVLTSRDVMLARLEMG